jgi:hypothetical protein
MQPALAESPLRTDMAKMDVLRCRYPFSIVWTPIPLITWIFPFIGHMGICYSSGVIRDFAGPYHVSEDNMAFGKPTRYLKLDINAVEGGEEAWDKAVKEASDIYAGRMHNLFCDNCHSHVAQALNLMQYKGHTNWNMVRLAIRTFFCAKYVSVPAFLKSWVPFLVSILTIVLFYVFLQQRVD